MTPETTSPLISVRLTSIRYAARGTHIFEFQQVDGGRLPSVDAGAHIDIHLPNGVVRQYSLINNGPSPQSYLVGVKRDPSSRGGSVYMHDRLPLGATMQIGQPRNNFPLACDSPMSVFIAGGIGITPIFSMIQRLESLKQPWSLAYACRSRAEAVFVKDLQRLGEVTFHFDDEQKGRFLDVDSVVNAAEAESHFYCCGPIPMLRSFELATAHLPPGQVHVEYFSPAEAPAMDGGYTVELQRSQREFYIPPGSSILSVLLSAGVNVLHSCETGVCGSCETAVISGQPDHRDAILDDRERAANKTMMICCSGSKSDRLVLDL